MPEQSGHSASMKHSDGEEDARQKRQLCGRTRAEAAHCATENRQHSQTILDVRPMIPSTARLLARVFVSDMKSLI
jgi:hypothetical protein